MSASLLNDVNAVGGLHVSGFAWQDAGAIAVLPPNALAARVLCARHNSAISPLDAVALRLFRAFNEDGAEGSGEQRIHLFSGADVERWILKTLCGGLFAGVFEQATVNQPIPIEWLRILFGNAEFTDGAGMYMRNAVGALFQGPRGVTLRPTGNAAGATTGLSIALCGYDLLLSSTGCPDRIFNGERVAYRPLEVHTVGRAYEKSVAFTWDGTADLGTLECQIGVAR